MDDKKKHSRLKSLPVVGAAATMLKESEYIFLALALLSPILPHNKNNIMLQRNM